MQTFLFHRSESSFTYDCVRVLVRGVRARSASISFFLLPYSEYSWRRTLYSHPCHFLTLTRNYIMKLRKTPIARARTQVRERRWLSWSCCRLWVKQTPHVFDCCTIECCGGCGLESSSRYFLKHYIKTQTRKVYLIQTIGKAYQCTHAYAIHDHGQCHGTVT